MFKKIKENKLCLINMAIISVLSIIVLNFPFDYEIVGGKIMNLMINPSEPFNPWSMPYNIWSYLAPLLIFPLSYLFTKVFLMLRIKNPYLGFFVGGIFGAFGASIIIFLLTRLLGGFRTDIPLIFGSTVAALTSVGFILAAVPGAIMAHMTDKKLIIFNKK